MKYSLFSILSYVCILSLLSISPTIAQEKWGLEKCITYALDNSLQVQRSDVNLSSSEIDVNQARHSRYPSLSGSTNVGWNFGRTIDPTNNQFVTETFFNNGFNLSSNVILYNAGKVNNTVKQTINNNKASKKDLEQAKRDIALNVATAYLNILFSKENLQNANTQLALTADQKLLLQKQIAVGNRPENDILDLDAQLATNEQSVVEAENNLMINMLNLKQLLRLEPDYDMDILDPASIELGTDPDIITFKEVYDAAVNNQANIAAGELRVQSAMIGEKIAHADLLPRIGAGISSSTNYSNKGITVTGYETVVGYQNIIFYGQSTQIGIEQEVPNFSKKAYFDQFTDNISYGLGVSMSIPIYNNNSARAGIQRAKLNTTSAQLNYTQLKETLKITIGQALSDAKAAKSRFQATNKTLLAQKNLYENAVKRFEIGNMNAFELTRLKTQMETSSVNLLIAKYDYLFKTKVLDFYLGKPIKL